MTAKIIKVQVFENDRRTDKSIFRGKSLKECVEKMIDELRIKGLI